jgi:hypothetical protein
LPLAGAEPLRRRLRCRVRGRWLRWLVRCFLRGIPAGRSPGETLHFDQSRDLGGGRRPQGSHWHHCFLLTVAVFGVTNSTCDDSSQLACDRNAAVGKMSLGDKVSVEHPGL